MGDKKRTVLIVEDDLILNLLYESYMEKLGFDPIGELVYGKTAIEMAKNSNPDLILMDIALEGEIDGIETMARIREFSDVPVIYITGNSDPFHKERAEATNFTDFLIKPIELPELRHSLKQAGLL